MTARTPAQPSGGDGWSVTLEEKIRMAVAQGRMDEKDLSEYRTLQARLAAVERVVDDLAEDIERRLVAGVGTISSQHVLRVLGRPWTFEEVSQRRLHGGEAIPSE